MIGAKDLWNERYGDKDRITDYSGRVIVKSAHPDKNSMYAWNIDHIRPSSKGGSNMKCNLEICHILTNEEKGDSFPAWNTNGNSFHAKKAKGKGKGCYFIERI